MYYPTEHSHCTVDNGCFDCSEFHRVQTYEARLTVHHSEESGRIMLSMYSMHAKEASWLPYPMSDIPTCNVLFAAQHGAAQGSSAHTAFCRWGVSPTSRSLSIWSLSQAQEAVNFVCPLCIKTCCGHACRARDHWGNAVASPARAAEAAPYPGAAESRAGPYHQPPRGWTHMYGRPHSSVSLIPDQRPPINIRSPPPLPASLHSSRKAHRLLCCVAAMAHES